MNRDHRYAGNTDIAGVNIGICTITYLPGLCEQVIKT